MVQYSTRQTAKKLGIDLRTLNRYIAAKKVPAPKTVQLGEMKVHAWSEKDIERMRKLLPKVENGRKTRFQTKKQIGTTKR